MLTLVYRRSGDRREVQRRFVQIRMKKFVERYGRKDLKEAATKKWKTQSIGKQRVGSRRSVVKALRGGPDRYIKMKIGERIRGY